MLLDELTVTKRDGRIEPFNLDKIHKVLFWACEGVSNVSVSEIEVRTHMQLYNKIPTSEIHETLIKSAADLISEDYPNYQFVAARLVNFTLRKQVYHRFDPPYLLDHVKKNVELKVYDGELLTKYDEDEWDKLDKIVNHERDWLLTYAATEQFRGKYLVQDRTTGKYYETPQMAYILIAATLFGNYPKETRLQYVKDYYDAISKGAKSTVTLPTPILAGVRTPTRQFSSCVLIEAGDSLDSINETASAIVDYASRRAGIGINAGRIRAKGSKVRGGEIFHTGNIPFYKYFHSALKSCSQGGVRGASATTYYPLWHLESEDLIVLKNNKGTEETRVRHMDYGVQINGYLYQRLLKNENITLFSPNEVPDLYNAFFTDQEKFAELYEKYERAYSVRKKTVSALELFNSLIIERNNTGRIYIHNVDHTNAHGSFNTTSPIRMSNLCVEITLPTEPLTRKSRIPFIKKFVESVWDLSCQEFREEYGEIALCTLSAINLAAINTPADFEKPADLAVRGLEELLDYQDYPMLAAGVPAQKRRSLGIGVSNLAYFIAKHGAKYSDGSANDLVNEYAEAMSYYLIKASINLAKERGPCDWYEETKYAKGLLPIDTYKSAVNDIVTSELKQDWESLRADLAAYGMRHSTVMALMPVESSSQVINATNGIEPPRGMVSVKGSKDGTLRQVVPEVMRLKNKYEYLWDMPHTRGYLEIAAIFQKYTDQSISTNTTYNPKNYPGNKVPMSELIKDLVYAYRLGIKTLYYQNTDDGSGDVWDPDKKQDDCESCKL
jgi:ribonucleoside-diphosphate reductase alpha chain